MRDLCEYARYSPRYSRDTGNTCGINKVVAYIRYGMRSGRRYAGWRGESGGGDGVCGEVDRGGDGGDRCGGVAVVAVTES